MTPTSPTPAPVTLVVGNPQAGSRTRTAGELVANRLGEPVDVIDLADHGPDLMGWGSPVVAELKARVLGAGRLVVASPTYKAAYTGLLKLFLDQFAHDELAGLTTVPLMTGGSADHALAVEVHLRPVLVEIGASCPRSVLREHRERNSGSGRRAGQSTRRPNPATNSMRSSRQDRQASRRCQRGTTNPTRLRREPVPTVTERACRRYGM